VSDQFPVSGEQDRLLSRSRHHGGTDSLKWNRSSRRPVRNAPALLGFLTCRQTAIYQLGNVIHGDISKNPAAGWRIISGDRPRDLGEPTRRLSLSPGCRAASNYAERLYLGRAWLRRAKSMKRRALRKSAGDKSCRPEAHTTWCDAFLMDGSMMQSLTTRSAGIRRTTPRRPAIW